MQTPTAEEKRSRSPEIRSDDATEVRERTPLRSSELSQSEDDTSADEPQLSSVPSEAQDLNSPDELAAKEPLMPYFLQLSDMGITSQSFKSLFHFTDIVKISIGSSMN